AFGSSYRGKGIVRTALKTTSTCTESATAERYRYTPLRSRLRKALIHLGFYPRHSPYRFRYNAYTSAIEETL
ncbi:MAG: hypothetical protein ACRESJ_03645, partial [Pseudomonas sp.]|uniref:hypothetical protein n=1 Tax=Pseudomonas sp. TaxID=306 RepID=UPI003D6EC402